MLICMIDIQWHALRKRKEKAVNTCSNKDELKTIRMSDRNQTKKEHILNNFKFVKF